MRANAKPPALPSLDDTLREARREDRKVWASLCPVCWRHFTNLPSHMAIAHWRDGVKQ